MNAPICTTSQFRTNNGILGLDRSAIPRIVVESTATSTGDGKFSQQYPFETLPKKGEQVKELKLMIDQRVHWKNDYNTGVQVQVEIQRARRTMFTSAPNYAFIRERYETATGFDTGGNEIRAEEPDPTEKWATEWGGGIDIGLGEKDSNGDNVPRYGQFRLSLPESSFAMPLLKLADGESIDVRFRASLITPYLWWTNVIKDADTNEAMFQMYAFANTIRITAYPEPVLG